MIITDFQSTNLPEEGISKLEYRDRWIGGTVTTPYGIVIVYTQGDHKKQIDSFSKFEFVFDGVLHTRFIKGRLVPERMKVEAVNFVQDVTSKF